MDKRKEILHFIWPPNFHLGVFASCTQGRMLEDQPACVGPNDYHRGTSGNVEEFVDLRAISREFRANCQVKGRPAPNS
jgi:hypothetical protein